MTGYILFTEYYIMNLPVRKIPVRKMIRYVRQSVRRRW